MNKDLKATMVIDDKGVGYLILRDKEEKTETFEFSGLTDFDSGIYEVLEFIRGEDVRVTLGHRIGGLTPDEM